ncbi:peptidylprolyl isomerase [Dactylosporangium sp. NPDC006015]|uniref:peptidylprolyl isomerase n=1 Tax=Dactylosporangium sp. NPDC006015 TaxID=3154576 RepID=UPI0033AAD290
MKRLTQALAALLVTAGMAGCTGQPQAARRVATPAAPSPAATAECRWSPVRPGNQVITKDVGTPPATVPSGTIATMTLTTNLGTIEITMDAKVAPCAVASFAYLAGKQFFDGSPCHRLGTTESLSILQCGDPSGTGTGGPAYQYAEENLGPKAGYLRDTVAVSRWEDPGTSGSQFFINYADNPGIPANYSLIGIVTKGMDIVKQVAAAGVVPETSYHGDGTPKLTLTLQHVTVAYV